MIFSSMSLCSFAFVLCSTIIFCWLLVVVFVSLIFFCMFVVFSMFFVCYFLFFFFFFFSSRRRHTSYWRDWSSDVCSSDLSYRRTERSDKARSVAPSSPRHITTSVAERDGGCGGCATPRVRCWPPSTPRIPTCSASARASSPATSTSLEVLDLHGGSLFDPSCGLRRSALSSSGYGA